MQNNKKNRDKVRVKVRGVNRVRDRDSDRVRAGGNMLIFLETAPSPQKKLKKSPG